MTCEPPSDLLGGGGSGAEGRTSAVPRVRDSPPLPRAAAEAGEACEGFAGTKVVEGAGLAAGGVCSENKGR